MKNLNEDLRESMSSIMFVIIKPLRFQILLSVPEFAVLYLL